MNEIFRCKAKKQKNIRQGIKRVEITLLAAVLLTCTLSTVQFAASCDDIRDRVLRLHILANSDAQADQAVKLKVRDAVLAEGKDIFDGSTTAQNAEQVLTAQTDRLESTANRVLAENGFPYTARIEVGSSFFTTRSYENKVTLPAGRYTAVRILLGEAKGHNWWCVMFPPMCLPAAQGDVKMEDVLNEQEEKIVESSPKYEMRFKLVEVLEKFLNKRK